MSFKCKICGNNEVRNEGDMCPSCSWKIKAYLDDQAKAEADIPGYAEKVASPVHLDDGSVLVSPQPKGENVPVRTETAVESTPIEELPDYHPTNYTDVTISPEKGIVSSGIIKNVEVKSVKRNVWSKWLRALFFGEPVTTGDETTYFQVFQDKDGLVRNAYGRECDQVMIYGRLKGGTVSEGNSVEVYGHRCRNHCIKAKKLVNASSGTVIKPSFRLSCLFVWIVTLLLLGGVVGGLAALWFLTPVGAFVMKWGWLTALIVLTMILLIVFNLPKAFKIVGVAGGVIGIVALLILYFMNILA